VTDGAPVQGDPSPDNEVFLRLAAGPLAGPVLCRVISMVLARAHCPMDRLDDAMIVCDAISAHASSYARDGHLAFTVAARGRELTLRVAELADEGARKLVQDAIVPGLGNVLERMTDELRVEPSQDGLPEELVLALSFR
jgi:serine/threonine-protein kinase RsbW